MKISIQGLVLGALLVGANLANAQMDPPTRANTNTRATAEVTTQAQIQRCATIANEVERKACLVRIGTGTDATLQNPTSAAEIKARMIYANEKGVQQVDDGVGQEQKNSDQRTIDQKGAINPYAPENGDERMRSYLEFVNLHVTNVVNYVLTNLVATHDRISTLADRIEARIKKTTTENTDTAAGFVASARTELKLAMDSIEKAKIAFKDESANVSTSATGKYRVDFQMTFASIVEAKAHLKAAHRDLASAISSLKPGVKDGVTTDIKADTSVKAVY